MMPKCPTTEPYGSMDTRKRPHRSGVTGHYRRHVFQGKEGWLNDDLKALFDTQSGVLEKLHKRLDQLDRENCPVVEPDGKMDGPSAAAMPGPSAAAMQLPPPSKATAHRGLSPAPWQSPAATPAPGLSKVVPPRVWPACREAVPAKDGPSRCAAAARGAGEGRTWREEFFEREDEDEDEVPYCREPHDGDTDRLDRLGKPVAQAAASDDDEDEGEESPQNAGSWTGWTPGKCYPCKPVREEYEKGYLRERRPEEGEIPAWVLLQDQAPRCPGCKNKPVCGKVMFRQKATKGGHFWGCPDYYPPRGCSMSKEEWASRGFRCSGSRRPHERRLTTDTKHRDKNG